MRGFFGAELINIHDWAYSYLINLLLVLCMVESYMVELYSSEMEPEEVVLSL